MITTPTAADLRAEIARRRVKLYVLAVIVGLHPTRLSLLLNDHAPLSPALAQRIMDAITRDGEVAAAR